MRAFLGNALAEGMAMPGMRSGNDNTDVPLLQRARWGSQISLRDAPRIENIVEWDLVRRKYRTRFGGAEKERALGKE